MYVVEVHTAPAGRPLTAAELSAHLNNNNGTAEDTLLEEFIDAAVEQFEADTRRPVLATTYRQYVTRWPSELVLGRAGVTAIAGAYRYLADGTTTEAVSYRADIRTPPARVILADPPDLVDAADGSTVAPAGYVEFSAGWANAAAVPKRVRVAIKLLAAHFYANREAFTEGRLTELPLGWWAIVNNYRLGLSGPWGQ